MEERQLQISNFQQLTIEKLLEPKDIQYSVSDFQRDYSWTKDEWSELFSDIIKSYEEKRKHFFGFMTFYKPRSENEVQIIEGQQRLATVTILACAVRDLLSEKKDSRWKEVEARYVKNTETLYTPERIYDKLLLSDTDRNFFKEHIQKEGLPKEKIDNMRKRKRLKSSQRLVRDCYEYFYEQLKTQHLILELLRQVAKQFVVITTEVGNLNSAYILFQTLNDRGLDLTLSDLLKTHLLSIDKECSADIKKDWDYIKSGLQIDNMNLFLRHYWLSKEGTVEEDELFDKFSNKIRSIGGATKFIGELKQEAEYYSILANPEMSSFGNRKIVALLTDQLYVLSKQQVLPLLLAVYQKFSHAETVKVIEALTDYVFRYLTIGAQENKELERLFSSISIDIRADKIRDCASVINELKRKDIKDTTFSSLFKEKQIRDNRKAKYILRKIEDHLSRSGEERTPSPDITLEHIFAVNPDNECRKYMEENDLWDYRDEWVFRIGNMTLLGEEFNRSGQNKLPMIKSKDQYNKSTLEINKDLRNLNHWTAEDIEKRQEKFANCAVKIWKL